MLLSWQNFWANFLTQNTKFFSDPYVVNLFHFFFNWLLHFWMLKKIFRASVSCELAHPKKIIIDAENVLAVFQRRMNLIAL